MLELNDLSRSFGGEPALVRVSLQIGAGMPCAIVGLSARAREAMVRLLTAGDKPSSGSIKLNGVDIARARREKGSVVRIGPAAPAASGQKVSRLIGREAAVRAGLADVLEAKVSGLDPTRRLLLAVASALDAEPDLLILDAPAIQLSPEARETFLTHLAPMALSARGVVLLLASAADEAIGLCGEIVVMDRGSMVQRGKAADVSAHPVSLASAAATSWPTLNTLPMLVRDGRGVLADGSSLQPPEGVMLPPEGACTLGFHPEDVTLERASPGCVRFVVRAGAEEPRGAHRFLRVSFAGASWLCPLGAAAPHPGALLNAFVDRSHLMLFDAAGRAIT
jgi:ABC-type sugar transport system ATPase subunit